MLSSRDRHSFDRFNHDLLAVLIRHLSLTDKLAAECVSRQWRDCVYAKQTALRVDYRHKFEDSPPDGLPLDRVRGREAQHRICHGLLSKLTFLTRIEFGLNCSDEIVALIADNCHFLAHISLNGYRVSERSLMRFAERCGPRLQSFALVNCAATVDYRKFLSLCPNLETVNIQVLVKQFAVIVDSDREYLPKLKAINSYFFVDHNRPEQAVRLWRAFADKYSRQLTVLPKVYSNCAHEPTNREILGQISRFERLEEIKLIFDNSTNEEVYIDINADIDRIARCCRRVKRFAFSSSNRVLLDTVFTAIGRFADLVELDLRLYEYVYAAKRYDIIGPLKHCRRLRSLVLYYVFIDAELVAELPLHLPGLVSVSLKTNQELTDEAVVSLSELRQLRHLRLARIIASDIGDQFSGITDASVCQLIRSCAHLRSLVFKSRPAVTDASRKTLLEVAKARQVPIRFCFQHYRYVQSANAGHSNCCQFCESTVQAVRASSSSPIGHSVWHLALDKIGAFRRKMRD